MDKRIFSSSVSGYVIIGRLTDSVYNVSFGFPKDEWPGQNVTITVKEADAGYLLKNFDEKGWGLLNLQTMQLLMPVKKAEDKNAIEIETLGDEFSTMLASVVNDPTIAQRIIIKTDTAATGRSPEIRSEEKPLVKEEMKPAPGKNEILKLKYDTGTEGISIAYLDIVNGVTDTVKLFIPAAEPTIVTRGRERQAEKPRLAKAKKGSKNKDARFIDMDLQNPNAKPDTNKITDQVIREKKASSNELPNASADSSAKEIKGTVNNSRCRNFASYEDFINLRKLMAAEENYEDMINSALKKFKTNCYSTEQVKNLGTMFLNDEGKYKFYVMAYPFVSDPQNFGTLENQLTDKSFITKFRAIPH